MVNWSVFESLQGAAEDNFEMLCRSLVWLHYGKFGRFRALANQPGVEFHLELTSDCALGGIGKWFGWQCKWYTIPRGRAIGKTRRDDIEDSLQKSRKELPGLTDWVLCTRYPLTEGDQEWYYGLTKEINLHLWHAAGEIETLLSGEGEIFRQTYFGDLVLSNDRLNALHAESVAPIRKRWFPEVHQPVQAERTIRQMLGEHASWDNLSSIANDLRKAKSNIERELPTVPSSLLSATQTFLERINAIRKLLEDVSSLLMEGDLDVLFQQLNTIPKKLDPEIAAVTRKLRGARLCCGSYATNALSDLKYAIRQLADVNTFISNRCVAVVADAGGGKTQLCAEITQANPSRPAGILLLGRFLHRGKTLDTLVAGVVLNGKPVSTMNGLLAALNAAGQRNKRRLPLVIDGLNEAEDPREWKPLLASLIESLKQFPHVLIVCTLRTGGKTNREHDRYVYKKNKPSLSFTELALPDDVFKVEIPDFEKDTADAVKRYFSFFRITGDLRAVPMGLLRHPLTLRIFCEVANPKRDRDVGIEAVPRTLAGLFEKYIELATERIAELSDHSFRIYPHDVNQSLDILGSMLWKRKSRELDEKTYRIEIGDSARDWSKCIVTFLEQEGLILRSPGDRPGDFTIMPVYDLLGGYLIAESLVRDLGGNDFPDWLKKAATLKVLSGDYNHRHPLADDIFRSFVALVPRRLHSKQVWQLVEEPLRTKALGYSILLEAAYLDSDTIGAIRDQITSGGSETSEFLRRLFVIHSAPKHPLNADFLTAVLSDMSVSDRDLIWTEWLRKNLDYFIAEATNNIQSWRTDSCLKTVASSLTATWTMWMLTSTSVKLRYLSTKALYWYGRTAPEDLFNKTLDAAKVNDPYVFERMMAASYGAAMALVCNDTCADFRTTILPAFARQLFEALFREKAQYRTTHVLTRDYALHLIELATYHNRKLFKANESKLLKPPFKKGGTIVWEKVKPDKKLLHQTDSPIKMDFENYTIGSLVRDRAPYEFENPDFISVHSKIFWRIANLGWSKTKFAEVEKSIENGRYGYSRQDNDINKVDRYGKKYSWIAYFEVAGWLEDNGKRREDYRDSRTWDIDIDPSYPEPYLQQKMINVNLLGDPTISVSDWFKNGQFPSLVSYLHQNSIASMDGPWVVLDGYVSRNDDDLGRSIFTFIRTFLVAKNKKNDLITMLRNQRLGGRWLPEKPEFRNLFSGELPWSEMFHDASEQTLKFEINEREVVKREKVTCYYLDGKEVKLSHLDELRMQGIDLTALASPNDEYLPQEDFNRLEERVETRPIRKTLKDVKKIDVIMPVVDIHVPGLSTSDITSRGQTLTKNISKLLNLRNIQQSCDLQTIDGIRATMQTVFSPNSYRDSEHFFFIRKDFLDAILSKLGLCLVWAIWGEKELSIGQFESLRESGADMSKRYADIKEIQTY